MRWLYSGYEYILAMSSELKMLQRVFLFILLIEFVTKRTDLFYFFLLYISFVTIHILCFCVRYLRSIFHSVLADRDCSRKSIFASNAYILHSDFCIKVLIGVHLFVSKTNLRLFIGSMKQWIFPPNLWCNCWFRMFLILNFLRGKTISELKISSSWLCLS